MEPEDMAEEVIHKLKNICDKLDMQKQLRANLPGYSIKKNSHLHLSLESDLHDCLKLEANGKGMTISELCRQKLREKLEQPNVIEAKLDNLDRKLRQIINQISKSKIE